MISITFTINLFYYIINLLSLLGGLFVDKNKINDPLSGLFMKISNSIWLIYSTHDYYC